MLLVIVPVVSFYTIQFLFFIYFLYWIKTHLFYTVIIKLHLKCKHPEMIFRSEVVNNYLFMAIVRWNVVVLRTFDCHITPFKAILKHLNNIKLGYFMNALPKMLQKIPSRNWNQINKSVSVTKNWFYVVLLKTKARF